MARCVPSFVTLLHSVWKWRAFSYFFYHLSIAVWHFKTTRDLALYRMVVFEQEAVAIATLLELSF
mgnify:CR=1 FL=1